MTKGYYLFRESGGLTVILLLSGIANIVVSLIFLFLGGHMGLTDGSYYFTLHNAWFLFFFLLGVLLLVINACVHRVCRDVATLLKEIEEKKTV